MRRRGAQLSVLCGLGQLIKLFLAIIHLRQAIILYVD
jgi:hypothetical protein